MQRFTSTNRPKKRKYYVVWKGRKIGIFATWDECEAQVKGFPGAQYKSFDSPTAAEAAYHLGHEAHSRPQHSKLKPNKRGTQSNPILPSYCVDASCSGNPGILEYRCVYTETREIIFTEGPFQQGTNNIGEFLAIVHALSFFKKERVTLPIYTDSRNAIGWIQAKKCKTKLAKHEKNADVFELVDRAENWLRNNTYKNKIVHWNTQMWGENPADYGRK
jgi:ribonuclease HI